MSSTEPSQAFLDLKHYAEAHSSATLILRVAAQDYAASRCLLLNGLFPGLVAGAQAMEKTLKAYLLFADPKRNVKTLSHSLPALLTEARSLFPKLAFSTFVSMVEKFRRHYQTRYPDNTDASTNMTTADMFELDGFIVFLNENLPCPRNVKYRTGFYAAIMFSSQYKAAVTPLEFWIKNNNNALAPLIPRIETDYAAVMEELYPKQP